MTDRKLKLSVQGSRESLGAASPLAGATPPREGSGSLRLTPTGSASSLRLSRPSSREQILNEFRGSGKPDTASILGSFNAVKTARGQGSTTVHFKVSAMTNLGDKVVVVGNCNTLGLWEPRNGLVLQTNSTIFPTWQVEAAVPTGDVVEYKYVIVGADGEARWETDIDNRMFTPEGTRTVLEDGQFNVETARLLNESKESVEKKGKRGARHFTEMEMDLESDDTLYVLSYRLPLACSRDTAGNYSFEWLTMLSDSTKRQRGDSKVMRSMSRHATYVIESLRQLRPRCNVWFVGGLAVDVDDADREGVVETLARDFQCIPVFLPKDMASEFEDLCHDVLKPIFHFVHPTSGGLSRSFDRSSTSWQLYCEVNNYYVTPLVEHCNEGDFVFVFDPELLMAPNLIGSRARTANVGFFFNVPFPSSEIFRTLPVRKQVLTSLLNADFIQFHDYTYARHFLSCCSALLGLEHRPTRGGLTQVQPAICHAPDTAMTNDWAPRTTCACQLVHCLPMSVFMSVRLGPCARDTSACWLHDTFACWFRRYTFMGTAATSALHTWASMQKVEPAPHCVAMPHARDCSLSAATPSIPATFSCHPISTPPAFPYRALLPSSLPHFTASRPCAPYFH